MNKGKKGKETYKYDKIYSRKGEFYFLDGSVSSWVNANGFLRGCWLEYGHAVEGKQNIEAILKLKPRNIIDIGCGGNEFCQLMKNSGIPNSIGVDCSCPDADIIASAHDLSSINDKAYDLLVSFDVMEHLPEEEVVPAFKEFSRIANRMFIKVSLSDIASSIDNEVLHTCVKPHWWWVDRAEVYFKAVKWSHDTTSIVIQAESKQ